MTKDIRDIIQQIVWFFQGRDASGCFAGCDWPRGLCTCQTPYLFNRRR